MTIELDAGVKRRPSGGRARAAPVDDWYPAVVAPDISYIEMAPMTVEPNRRGYRVRARAPVVVYQMYE